MLVLTILAILPGAYLIRHIYKADKVEKEPKGLLLKIFILSCLFIIPTVILEMLTGELLYAFFEDNSAIAIFLENVLCVALIEELSKYLPMKLLTWKHPAFNYRFDAVVYAVTSAMGFAIIENVLYSWSYGFGTTIMRALLSVPAHAMFGIFMGYYYGKAKAARMQGDKRAVRRNLRLAVLIPMLIHGFDDFCLSMDSDIYMLIYIVFVVVYYVAAIKKERALSRHDAPVDASVSDSATDANYE